jgi:hypothetical protein
MLCRGHRVRRAIALVTSVALVVTVAGCGSSSKPPRACTLIGCSSGVMVVIPAKARRGTGLVTVCAAAKCLSVGKRGNAVVGFRMHPGGPGPVSVVLVQNRAGLSARVISVSARLIRNQPNGPGCGPPCWYTSLVYRGGRLVRGGLTRRLIHEGIKPYGSVPP